MAFLAVEFVEAVRVLCGVGLFVDVFGMFQLVVKLEGDIGSIYFFAL